MRGAVCSHVMARSNVCVGVCVGGCVLWADGRVRACVARVRACVDDDDKDLYSYADKTGIQPIAPPSKLEGPHSSREETALMYPRWSDPPQITSSGSAKTAPAMGGRYAAGGEAMYFLHRTVVPLRGAGFFFFPGVHLVCRCAGRARLRRPAPLMR